MKPVWLLSAVLMLAACSPEIYSLHLDVRQPSPSGLDLSRRSFSVVYLDGSNAVDSLFDRSVASALARQLEGDYFDGREEVGLYHIPTPDSLNLDLMHNLVMDTNADVIFLLASHLGEPAVEANAVVPGATSVDSAFVCPVSLPVKTSLDVYDSMGEDQIRHFNGSATLRGNLYNNGLLSQEGLREAALAKSDVQGEEVGNRIANRFLSQWKTESFSFYYFEGWDADIWESALLDLYKGKFNKAMDTWMGLVKKNSEVKQACAAYNMAQAFYLLEDYEMSARWLETALKWEDLSLAPGLQKRLAPHLEKLQK